jgi:hypothetical protein
LQSSEWRLLWKRAVVTLLQQLMLGEAVEMQRAVADYVALDVLRQLPEVQHCPPAFEEARALAVLLKAAASSDMRHKMDAAAMRMGLLLP